MTSAQIREKARRQTNGDLVGAYYQDGRVVAYNYGLRGKGRQVMDSRWAWFLGVYDKDIKPGMIEEDIQELQKKIVALTKDSTTLFADESIYREKAA